MPSCDRQTNLEMVDESHCVFALESAETINHICVFMLGTGVFIQFTSSLLPDPNTVSILVPFPPGYAGTVHFYWPGKGFQLLGM